MDADISTRRGRWRMARRLVGSLAIAVAATSMWGGVEGAASDVCRWDAGTASKARLLESSWPAIVAAAAENELDVDSGAESSSSTGMAALHERGATEACAGAHVVLAASEGSFSGRVTAFSSWDHLAELVSTQTRLASYSAHHSEPARQAFWASAELDIAGEETDIYCGTTLSDGCQDYILLRRSTGCVPLHTFTTAYTRNHVPWQTTLPRVAGSLLSIDETVTTTFNLHGLAEWVSNGVPALFGTQAGRLAWTFMACRSRVSASTFEMESSNRHSQLQVHDVRVHS